MQYPQPIPQTDLQNLWPKTYSNYRYLRRISKKGAKEPLALTLWINEQGKHDIQSSNGYKNCSLFLRALCKAGVAQLARARPCQGRGRGFEPHHPLHHLLG